MYAVGKLTRYAYDYQNVVASGTASNMIVPGQTLEYLRLKLGGGALTKAMLSRIKVKANGQPVIDATGPQIDAINSYKGVAANAAYLPIFFIEPAGDTDLDRGVGAFDTSRGVANLTTEVTIAGATTPTLKGILEESAPQVANNGKDPAPFAGVIGKLLAYPLNMPNGGRLPHRLPFGMQDGAIIKRIHVFHTGNMTGAVVKADSTTIHESLKAENEHDQVSWGRTPQTNCYTIDFIKDGQLKDALDTRMVRNLEVLFDFSAADSGEVLVEYLDVLGHL